MLETGVVYIGDCVEVMGEFDEKCVDMVFLDPPYNLNKNTGPIKRPEGGGKLFHGVEDEWDKFSSIEEYKKFSMLWLEQVRRVLKDNGSIWVMGTYHNIHLLGYLLMEMGWFILNDIVWVKPNPVPQFRGVRFCNSIETLIWAVKKRGCGYTFNYWEMKELNGGKQMRADWNGIGICIGKERIKDDNGNKAHSTQKPEKLLERIILSSTRPGNVILDPFFGTGTTGVVSERLDRKWVGIEARKHYAEIAMNRIENA